MGPACAVVDSVSGLLVFISVGTTNLIARAVAMNETATTRRRCTVSLALASLVGAIVGAAMLLTFSSPHRWVPALELPLATACADYVRIRSWAMPAATALMAAQASCLGAKDSRTPAFATILSSVVNVFGDIFLVLGPPKMGVKGAAYATVACQYAAFFTCFDALLKRGFLKNVPELLREKKSLLLADVRDFFKFGGFMGVTFFKQVTYNQAVYLATLLGPAASAAHQVIYSLSRFCFTLGDVTGATAQAFLPPIYDALGVQTMTARRVVLKVLAMSAMVAFLASSLALGGPTLFPFAFSRDPAVVHLMRIAAPWAAAGLLFHPVVVGLEGALLARGDLPWLLKNYLLTGSLSVVATFGLARLTSLSLPNIWQYLLCYQITRFSAFVHRAIFASSSAPQKDDDLPDPLPAR